ncbi:MAG: TIGR03758 family integrating conjugative element protein [Gammaproteobacteria bacterium]|nr:TIGR03758 family integrating conjugative element protein [Gammaproteobacteria bacterium]
MDAAQQAAFRGANPGVPVSEADLLALCAGLVCALALVWCAWVVFHAYKNWGGGASPPGEAAGHALRAVFLTVVLLAVVTW